MRVDEQEPDIRRQRRTSGQRIAKSISIKDAKRRSGNCARKATELTPGGLRRVPSSELREPRGDLTTAQKSAEGILGGAIRRRPERMEGEVETRISTAPCGRTPVVPACSPRLKGEAQRRGDAGTEASPPMHAFKLRRPSFLREQVSAQSTEPPCTDPYARWCGRGGAARLPLSRSKYYGGRPSFSRVVLRSRPC